MKSTTKSGFSIRIILALFFLFSFVISCDMIQSLREEAERKELVKKIEAKFSKSLPICQNPSEEQLSTVVYIASAVGMAYYEENNTKEFCIELYRRLDEIIGMGNSEFYGTIRDLSPLSEMTNLEILEAGRNKISDISHIKNLKKLKVLNLHENQIKNISILSGLTELQELDLGKNPITSLSP